MLIAVDIGNSSINIGYFTESGLVVNNISTSPFRTAEEYKLIFQDFSAQNHIEKKDFNCIISSVVPSLTAVIKNTFEMTADREEPNVLIVDYKMNLKLKLAVSAPEEMGTDRIANAVGAFEIYGAPVAVIDFGTATTLTVVDKDGNCIGGSILPGIGLMNDSLEKGTSKLKKIKLGGPAAALGKDTAQCILSGLLYGTAGAVERILSEIERETACKFRVVVTGGYASLLDHFFFAGP